MGTARLEKIGGTEVEERGRERNEGDGEKKG